MLEETAETVETTDGGADVLDRVEAAANEALATSEPSDDYFYDDEPESQSADDGYDEAAKLRQQIDRDAGFVERGRAAAAMEVVDKALATSPEASSKREALVELAKNLARQKANPQTIENKIRAEARRWDVAFREAKDATKKEVDEILRKEREQMGTDLEAEKQGITEQMGKPIVGSGTPLSEADAISSAQSPDELIKVLNKMNIKTESF